MKRLLPALALLWMATSLHGTEPPDNLPGGTRLPNERPGSGAIFDAGSGRQYANLNAFAALKADGSITAWGESYYGGSGAPSEAGYTKLYSNQFSFAALKADGSITAWGANGVGGSDAPVGAGFTAISSTTRAFAALKADGSITAWGMADHGGSGAPTDTGYVAVYSTDRAFAALKADGSITAWGGAGYGGTDAPTGTGFVAVYSTQWAFAALKEDGSITAWGSADHGGTGAPTGTGYTAVYPAARAFAALKADGSITAWGDGTRGGSGAPTDNGFIEIYSAGFAFAALKADGSITAWGDAALGGSGAPAGTGFTSISSNRWAFAALKADGSISSWGSASYGGSGAPAGSGFTAVYSNEYAFAALKEDGSISAWGPASYGGSGAPADGGYTSVSCTNGSFAALKEDGSIATWGYGGSINAPSGTGFTSVHTVSAPPTAPAAPTALVATAGDAHVSIAFNPGANGFSAITNYEFSTDNGSNWTAFSPAVTTSPVMITGLTNNTAYSLRLRAINAVGTGAASDVVNATPVAIPSAPTSLIATTGDSEATIAFTPGGSGGSAITNYEFSTDNGSNWTAFSPAVTSSPVVITGLSNGATYSIRLRAVNALGSGISSAAVSVMPGDTPSAPSSLIATIGDGQVSISFTPGADGGIAITNYEFSTDSGSNWTAFSPAVTTSPVMITGLTNDTTYGIRLRAVNILGSGAASDVVNATPRAPAISATPAQITLAGVRGTASPSRTIYVTGVSLNADILATASAGFEISADNVIFGATATLPAVAGSVDGSLHVRLVGSSTAALGQSTGSLTLSNNLASTVTVGLQGFIEADLPAYGTVQTFAGTGTSGSTDGNATTARFNGPWGISVDAQGNLYPIDYSGKRIRKVTTGAVASFLDAFSSFPPQYSAVDPATGHLYVSIETHRILRYVNKNAANYPAQAPVYGPETDFSDSVIVYAGASTSGSTNSTGTSARFNVPRGIAVHDGHLYVADRNNNAIRKINLSNAAVTTVTLTQGSITAPEGIAVDPAGVLFVTSTSTDSIVRISTAGVVSTVAGGGGSGYQDGTGSGARFNDPHGITLDSLGNLIVADSGNHAIRRVTPAGKVVTVAGGSASGSHSDGLGTAARFNSPRGLVFGPDGWLYVTDFNNHRIRRVNADQPEILLTPGSLSPFTTDFGSASASQTVEVRGYASAGLITITAPDGFEVSTDGTTYASSAEVTSTATLQVRIAASATTGALSGELTFASENAGTQTLALSGVVNLIFTMSREEITGLEANTGNASASETITLNGDGFTGPMYIDAPEGFEISTDGTNFSSSVRLGESAARIQTIYQGEFGEYTTASGAANWRGSGTQHRNFSAFAAITSSGGVVTWGTSYNGANSSSVADRLTADVIELFSSGNSFAALKRDGSVVTWRQTSSSVAERLRSGVSTISSTDGAFAALKTDGSVVTWGDSWAGSDSSSVAAKLTSGVTEVRATNRAFAALKTDGSVVTWGDADYGGDSSSVASQISSGVTAIVSTESAFAALKTNGSVITWGNDGYGGDSSNVGSQLTSNVRKVYSSKGAFAALKNDGSVFTWGHQIPLRLDGAPDATNVAEVYSNESAFAALRPDGSVVTWGSSSDGGVPFGVPHKLTSGVRAVYSTDSAFAALKTDGSVVTWGRVGGDSSAVADQLVSGVTAIYANNHAFAALKSDGSLITWGEAKYGGNSSSVAAQLTSGVKSVAGNYYSFVALKEDGSIITWGDVTGGGVSAYQISGPANIGTPVNIPPSFPVTLHVRIADTTPIGPVSGDITFATENAGPRTLALSGEVILPRTPVVFRAPGVVYTGSTSVRLEGTVNPNGYDTTVQFEYGTTTSYGTSVPVTLADANGTTSEAVSLSLSDLATGIYHYRITATNIEGTISSSDGVFSIYIPSDGTPDTAYNSVHGSKLEGPSISVRDSAMDASGRWFAIGRFLAYSGIPASGLLCLMPDGTPDAEFHTNLGSGLSHSSNLYPTKILIRQNGKILISGQFESLNGTPILKGIASLNADGTLDTDFTAKLNALSYQFGFHGLAEQADGKILGSYYGKVLRLNPDGTPDDSFDSPIFDGMIGAMAVQSDGKILVASNFSGLKRLHPDGSADTEFNSTLGTNFNRDSGNMSVEVISVAPDGGIWVGGYFSQFNGQPVPGLVRLNPDGTLDSAALAAYGPAFTGSIPAGISDIHLQPDGKIVVCGRTASFYNSWTSIGLRRLNADGSPDLQFSSNLGFGLSGTPMTMAVRPTGELIIAGSITHINHQQAKGIIQLGWGSSMTPETQSLAATYGSAIEETQALTPSGTSGTASYSISPALPSGLNLDASTGVISGTPLSVVDTTTHTITATGSEGGTATSTLTLSVAKAPLTITAKDAVRPYGQSNPAFTVGITGFVNGDTLSAISGAAQISCLATASSSPGQYAITPSLGKLAARNYSFQNFVPGTLTVGKAAQTLSIAPLASSVPLKELINVSLSASSSAGLPVTLSLEAGSAATLAGSVGAYSLTDIGQTGTVTVRARQAGNGDYEAAQDVLVSFDVTKSNQAITFDAPSDKTFGDDPFTLAATADSGLPVTFTLISGPAQLEGSSITLTGAGEVVIRASQAGNDLYNEATAQTRSFSVGRAAQSLTFGTLDDVIYGDAPVALSATSDSGLDVTYDIVSGPATLVAGTVAHHAAGTVVVRASQEGDDNHLPAEPVERTLIVNPRTLTVTGAIAQDKAADETTTAQILGAQLEGVIDGDEVFLFNDLVGSFPQATPGSDLVVTTSMTVDGGDAGNYSLVQPSLTASITEPENRDAPSAPSSLVATAGDGQVSIAFTVGAEGGSAITNHEFSFDDGNNWFAFNPPVTTSPVVITGLTNGAPYSIRLRAVNANGPGAASEAVSTSPVAQISPPSFAGYAVSTREGKTLALSLAKVLARATDPDGGSVTLTQVFGPSTQGGTVSLTGTLNYTPPASFTGSDSFDIELTGSRGGTLRATVTVTVTGNTAAGQNQTQLRLRDGKVDLTFRGIPGRTYTIQRSTNLQTWTTLATVVAATDGRITFTDPSPPQPSGYYRAQ